jgi:hypothetical protein
MYATLAPTLFARGGDYLAFALAAIADRYVDELAEERLLNFANFTSAIALVAPLQLGIGLRAVPAAPSAGLPSRYGKLLLSSEDGFFK